jgi:hypothetical protein
LFFGGAGAFAGRVVAVAGVAVAGGAVVVAVVVGTVSGDVFVGALDAVPAPPGRATALDGVAPIGPMARTTAAAPDASRRARPGARFLEHPRALMPLFPTIRIELPLRTRHRTGTGYFLLFLPINYTF